MKDLFPYQSLSAVAEEARAALEAVHRLDGLERHYQTLLAERNRRILPFLLTVLPTVVVGALLIWAIQSIGWLPESTPGFIALV